MKISSEMDQMRCYSTILTFKPFSLYLMASYRCLSSLQINGRINIGPCFDLVWHGFAFWLRFAEHYFLPYLWAPSKWMSITYDYKLHGDNGLLEFFEKFILCSHFTRLPLCTLLSQKLLLRSQQYPPDLLWQSIELHCGRCAYQCEDASWERNNNSTSGLDDFYDHN